MDFETLIQKETIKLFNRFCYIDILSDKVSIYDNNDGLILVKTMAFYDYVQEISSEIYEQDSKTFLDNIQTVNIKKSGSYKLFECRMIKNSKIEKTLIFSMIVPNSNDQQILVGFLNDYSKTDSGEKIESGNRVGIMSSMVSDTILKIYNALDSSNDNNTATKNYITTLLDNLVNETPEFKKEFEKDIKSQVNKTKNTLLVADDDLITRNLIKKTFSDEFEIVNATNGKEAIDALEKLGIDNIVGMFLDLLMPVLDGFSVLEYLREKNILYKVPIIIISGAEDKETRQRVYQYNIADLLEKPFNLEVIKYRTKNLIKLYKTSNALNNMVISQYNDLNNIIDELVYAYKYDCQLKIDKIKKYSRIILDNIKEKLPEYKITDYSENAIINSIDLYDIGFYLVPRSVAAKTTITTEESEIIKKFPKYGKMISDRYLYKTSNEDMVKYSSDICLYCHEKYDGSGFPSKISGDSIPICAQIVSLAISIEKALRKGIDISKLDFIKEGEVNPKIVELLPKIISGINSNE